MYVGAGDRKGFTVYFPQENGGTAYAATVKLVATLQSSPFPTLYMSKMLHILQMPVQVAVNGRLSCSDRVPSVCHTWHIPAGYPFPFPAVTEEHNVLCFQQLRWDEV